MYITHLPLKATDQDTSRSPPRINKNGPLYGIPPQHPNHYPRSPPYQTAQYLLSSNPKSINEDFYRLIYPQFINT